MNSKVEWRRVSPVAMIYFLLASFRQAVNFWPVLVGFFAGGDALQAFILTKVLPVGVLLFLVSIGVRYWFFRYSVEGDRIQIHQGMISRARLTLYFDRVQQADIIQPFYFRPFGLATLGLESAGSRQQEVDLPGLPYARAAELKALILEYQEQQQQAGSETTEESASPLPDYELHLPWQEVARYGLMYNGLLFLAPLLAPFTQQLGPSMEAWFRSLEGTVVHRLILQWGDADQFWVLALMGVVGLIIGIALLFVVSVIIALFVYWDYHLVRSGDQYQYRAGLGTVKTRGFREHKLQQVVISQGLVARLLRRYTLVVKKAGSGGQQNSGFQDHKRFIVPVLDRDTLAQFQSLLDLPSPQWRRVSPVYIGQRTLVWGTILFALAGVAALLTDVAPAYGLLAYPLVALMAWRYWWCLGLYQDGGWLAVRSGFVGRRVRWMPIGKAQKASVQYPPWLKPWGLVHLSVWGASGRMDLPFMPAAAAVALRDATLFYAASFRGRWF